MKNSIVLVLGLLTLFSCGGLEQKEADVFIPDNLSRRDEMRFKQYMVEGKKIYLAKCGNCHMSNGQGMQRLYPPLAKADFLKNNLAQSICMVRTGYTTPLTINGIEYNQVMPEFKKLSALEIAEVMTYIGNKWGNQMGFIDVNKVQQSLKNCN
jgi:cytochrome c551